MAGIQKLPEWAQEITESYASHAANQFVLYGNTNDLFSLRKAGVLTLGALSDYLCATLLPKFDVIFRYDLGNGLRVERGLEWVREWAGFKEVQGSLPRVPRLAVEFLSRYVRYQSNLASLGKPLQQIAVVIESAEFVLPVPGGGVSYDLNALAILIRDWSHDPVFLNYAFVSFLLVEALQDLHPLVGQNPRSVALRVPLPDQKEILEYLEHEKDAEGKEEKTEEEKEMLAGYLTGLTLSSVDHMLKLQQFRKQPVSIQELAEIKKERVEKDCNGLISFIESKRSLADLYGMEAVKSWVRQDLQLWEKGMFEVMPMGYLISGPVGTGKTFLIECLAGEAGVPVVKLNNFRDKFLGTTEGNLEKIFKLLRGLGRCFVFVDEADQALGKRETQAHDGGLSGRIYSMFAQEMSRPDNRGKLLWVLASSRPDLIEVDLKRPGRVDVKIPIFPTTTAEEAAGLLAALSKRRKVGVSVEEWLAFRECLPDLLTPGAADALAIRLYRAQATSHDKPKEVILKELLEAYQPPVALEVMMRQIQLAVAESTELEFVPERFRSLR